MVVLEMPSQGYRFFVESVLRNLIPYKDDYHFFISKGCLYGEDKYSHFKFDMSIECGLNNSKNDFGIILDEKSLSDMDVIGKGQSTVKFEINEGLPGTIEINIFDNVSKCSIAMGHTCFPENLMFERNFDSEKCLGNISIDRFFIKKNKKLLKNKKSEIELYVKENEIGRMDILGMGTQTIKHGFNPVALKCLHTEKYRTLYPQTLGMSDCKKIEIYLYEPLDTSDELSNIFSYVLKTKQFITDKSILETVEFISESL